MCTSFTWKGLFFFFLKLKFYDHLKKAQKTQGIPIGKTANKLQAKTPQLIISYLLLKYKEKYFNSYPIYYAHRNKTLFVPRTDPISNPCNNDSHNQPRIRKKSEAILIQRFYGTWLVTYNEKSHKYLKEFGFSLVIVPNSLIIYLQRKRLFTYAFSKYFFSFFREN